jgi:uncharacterized membrane protein YfcA
VSDGIVPCLLAVLVLLLAFVIGIVLGMLGGGGAILMVPMLAYVARIEARAAIAMSLFVVAATSLVATILQARARAVRWRMGASFALGAVAGAFAGGTFAHRLPARALLLGFAALMVATSIAMLRGRAATQARAPHAVVAIGLGLMVGGLSGLVGAGGGFLIVPVLTMVAGLELREAIGTSVFVIVLQSAAGFAGHAAHVELDWTFVAAVTAAAGAGTIAGTSLARRIAVERLRRGFAWLVFAMALLVFARELPRSIAIAAGAASFVVLLVLTRKSKACTTSPRSPPSSAAP